MEENQNQGPTIKDFEELAQQLADVREKIDLLNIEYKKLGEEEAALEAKIIALLDAAEITSYKAKAGTIISSSMQSVSVPKGESKQSFFNYLKEAGIYDEVVTVNSQWLNGYYKKEMEAAREREDVFFTIPGLENPFTKTRLSFRKAK
jgi:hypothetical protein